LRERLVDRGVTDGAIHGRHALRTGITFDELVDAAIGGDRLDIVVTLSHGPFSVGQIAKQVGIKGKHTSKELKHLEEFGLVMFTKFGTEHIYRLTNRIRVYPRGDKLQFHLRMESGLWSLFNVDVGGSGDMVEPPDFFIDGAELKQWRQERQDAQRMLHCAREESQEPADSHGRQENQRKATQDPRGGARRARCRHRK
jgi:hypothetical protein